MLIPSYPSFQRVWTAGLVVGSALFAVACDDVALPSPETQESALVAPAPILTPEQVMIDDQLRREMAYPETVLVTPDLSLDPGFPLASLATREAITFPDGFAAPVPVLLPEGYGALATAFWTSSDTVYTARLGEADGLSVFIRGNRHFDIREELSHELLAAGYDPEAPHLAASHGVWTVQFMAFGVGYMLDVACSAGPSDPRCQDDQLARAVYASLVRVEDPR